MNEDTEELEEYVEAFPPPPKYYKNYATYVHSENGEPQQQVPISVFNAPLPPPKIPAGLFRMFGQMYEFKDEVKIRKPVDDRIKDLLHQREQQIKQENPNETLSFHEQLKQLKKMNHSILFNFFELLNMLLKSPSAKLPEADEHSILDYASEPINPTDPPLPSLGTEKHAYELKIQQIQLLFINITSAINTLRPQQAREQLTSILKEQLRRRSQATEKIKQSISECSLTLQQAKEMLSLRNSLPTTPSKASLEIPNDGKRKRDEMELEESSKSLLEQLGEPTQEVKKQKSIDQQQVKTVEIPEAILQMMQKDWRKKEENLG